MLNYALGQSQSSKEGSLYSLISQFFLQYLHLLSPLTFHNATAPPSGMDDYTHL